MLPRSSDFTADSVAHREDSHMHIRTLSIAATLLAITASFAADPPSTVYLNGPKSLAALQKVNPRHYARAERIIAAANEVCRPGPLASYYARFEAREISCTDMMFKASNPPKKQLAFTLDKTRYVALVTITDEAAKLVPLRNP